MCTFSIIFAVSFLQLVCAFPPANGKSLISHHHALKRSIVERNLNDPNFCVQNCSIVQPAPSDLANGNASPTILNCQLQKARTQCLEKCPDSEAKKVIVDNLASFSVLCDSPVHVLVKDSQCVQNQSVKAFETCDASCPPIPAELVSPAVVVDPFFSHSIFVQYDGDAKIVHKNLTDLCNFGVCQWTCKKPIFEKLCGKETTKRLEANYNLGFQIIPNLYVDLKVLDDVPKACKPFAKTN